MSVAKIIELSCESPKSFEDAFRVGSPGLPKPFITSKALGKRS